MNEPASALLRSFPYEYGPTLGVTHALVVRSATRRGAHGFRKPVSILAVREEVARDAEWVAAFVEAASLLAVVDHPALPPVDDVAEHAGAPFAVVPPLSGGALSRLLEAPAAHAKPLAIDVAAHIVTGIAAGVQTLHTPPFGGAALGGISSESIWITREGRIALLPTVRCPVARGAPESVSRYRAPEQKGGAAADERADVYALALLLWDLLALGRGSSRADSRDRTRSSPCMNSALVRLVLNSLSATPADRPKNAGAFRTELCRLVPSVAANRPSLASEAARLVAPLGVSESGTASPGSARGPLAAPCRPGAPRPWRYVKEPPFDVFPAPVRAAWAPASVSPAPAAGAGNGSGIGWGKGPVRSSPGRDGAGELHVVLGDATPRLLTLREPARRWVVGRGRSSDVVVRDPDMSREHFEVTYEAGRYRVRDLGSKNGLFVNGLPVDDGLLQPGDEVVAGATVLRFES